METLNYRQLSARFPLCPVEESSEVAWASLLQKWRDAGKLEFRRHWKYGPSLEGGNHPARFYDVPRVVRLVCLEARESLVRPKIAYLYQEYYDQFLSILSDAKVAKDATQKQANTP